MIRALKEKFAGAEAVDPELLNSELRFQRTFENAAVGMAHVAPDGTWLRVNRKLCEILRYDEAELLKVTFQELTVPEDLQSDLDLLEKVLGGEIETYQIEKRYLRKTGEMIWANLTVGCVRTMDGEVDYFISVIEDITDRKRILRELAASEQRFRAVQQTTPDGFMMLRALHDRSGDIIDFTWEYLNPAAREIIQHSDGDLVGKRLLEEYPRNREAGLFDHYRRVAETGEVWQDEYLYQAPRGPIWLRFTASPLEGGVAVSCADISAQKNSEHRLRRILNSVVGFVGVASPDGIMLEINDPTLYVSGLEREEVIGKPFWDCYWWHHSEQTQADMKAAVASAAKGERVRFDVEASVANGSRISVDFQIAPNFDEDGQVIELIPSAIDITERKRAEAQRELYLRELNHRVKNSLATIQAMASHTLREASDMAAFRTAFVGRLRAIAASHDMLVNSRQADADIRELVRRQVEPYATSGERQLKLEGPALILPAEIAHAFGLVLHELSTNAAKYGALSASEGQIHISWRTVKGESGDAAEIAWRESGGPPVSQPERRGFGSLLIEQSIGHAYGGASSMDFSGSGLVATFTLPLDREPAQ